MNSSFQVVDECLWLRLAGRLDAAGITAAQWRSLRTEVLANVTSSQAQTLFVDLRDVDYIDSRSLQQLRTICNQLATVGIAYVGPGLGLERLIELDPRHDVSPLLPRAPWETESGEFEVHSDDSAWVDEILSPSEPIEATTTHDFHAELVVDPQLEEAFAEHPLADARESDTPAGTAADTPHDTVATDATSDEPERPDFVVNLDEERVHLESGSDVRDHIEAPQQIEFTPHWHALIEGNEIIWNNPQALSGERDVSAGSQNAATQQEPAAPAATPPTAPTPAADGAAPDAAGLAPPTVPTAKLPTAPSLSPPVAANDDLLDGTRFLVEQLGNLRRKVSQLDAALDRGQAREAELTRELQATDSHMWTARRALSEAESQERCSAWSDLVAEYRQTESVTRSIVDFAAQWIDDRTTLAASVGQLLNAQPTAGSQDWQALAIATSTITREASPPIAQESALRLLAAASVVTSAFQMDPRHLLETVGDWFPFPEEAMDANATTTTLQLWRAALAIAQAAPLDADSWRQAIGSVAAASFTNPQQHAALRRILDTHSLYLPGCWVELTSGAIGTTLGASAQGPDQPQVLLLFANENGQLTPRAPQLYPQATDVGIAVQRIVALPLRIDSPPLNEATVSRQETPDTNWAERSIGVTAGRR
ncbi:MAG: STAS domain-containing protein [Planctomycetota bacterium]